MMRDFPSCFGENGVQVADSSATGGGGGGGGRGAQNMVSCIYRTHLKGHQCLVSMTWARTLMGQGFTIGIDDPNNNNQPLCNKVEIKPWLFSKKKGSKTLEIHGGKLEIVWDLSRARFGPGPEPLESFFVSVVFDMEMVLLLGDMAKEANRKANSSPPVVPAMLVAKREHVFGKRSYATKGQLRENGQFHDIVIECEIVGMKDPCLEIKIDKKRVMQVKRLTWKFRGNQTILVDGLPVEVFWDVHNWLFGTPMGNAVFMFQTGSSPEKLLLLPCGQGLGEEPSLDLGFSLVLYAWKNE